MKWKSTVIQNCCANKILVIVETICENCHEDLVFRWDGDFNSSERYPIFSSSVECENCHKKYNISPPHKTTQEWNRISKTGILQCWDDEMKKTIIRCNNKNIRKMKKKYE